MIKFWWLIYYSRPILPFFWVWEQYGVFLFSTIYILKKLWIRGAIGLMKEITSFCENKYQWKQNLTEVVKLLLLSTCYRTEVCLTELSNCTKNNGVFACRRIDGLLFFICSLIFFLIKTGSFWQGHM